MIRSPYDLHIGFERDAKASGAGEPRRAASGALEIKLRQILHLVNEREWRYPDRPTVQLSLPYCFVCEETCYITQLDLAHYRKDPLPGTIFGGRFPIHAWVRPLMWAFEWHDTGKDLIVKRGDPLFYCQFEADGPDRAIQLVASSAPPRSRPLKMMTGVSGLVNQTFSLFRAAEAARPENLLVPRR